MADERPIEVIFFDVKDTLGDIFRPGKLTPYRPSTDILLASVRNPMGLRVGIISNLPSTLTREQGMKMLEDAGLLPALDADLIVFNHDLGVDKPHPAIYQFAAQRAGVHPWRCMFVGENLLEVIGAQSAGMQATLKPCPPGREFLAQTVTTGTKSATSSGRVAELLIEDDHAVGKRIVGCAAALVTKLDGFAGPWQLLPLTSMSVLVYLLTHFIDRYHHKMEEDALFPLAIARGANPKIIQRVLDEHEEGRAYFRGMEMAIKRVRDEHIEAVSDFKRCTAGFVELYKAHGPYENDVVLPEIGYRLTDADDVLLSNLIKQAGPPDATPYVNLIAVMEQELGITPG